MVRLVAVALLTGIALLVAVAPTAAGNRATGAGSVADGEPRAEDPAAEDPAVEDPAEQELSPEDEALAAQLREGAAVYTAICSSCHQPGGAGLPGQFPPLVDNPHVADAAYVAEVINNGRTGEIVVGGVTYNGVMPAFSTLSDTETQAVIAYIQNGFRAPIEDNGAAGRTGPVAGTELPALTNMSSIVAFALAAATVGLVLAPRLLSVNDRLAVPWLDAWLKTGAIVAAVVFFTIYVPDWVLRTETVSKLSRTGQDFIGVSLWSFGLAIVIGGLWYAHRESRV